MCIRKITNERKSVAEPHFTPPSHFDVALEMAQITIILDVPVVLLSLSLIAGDLTTCIHCNNILIMQDAVQ